MGTGKVTAYGKRMHAFLFGKIISAANNVGQAAPRLNTDIWSLRLWHMPKSEAPYICIEPWCGLPDVVGSGYNFAEKEGMHALAVGGHFARTHTITIG